MPNDSTAPSEQPEGSKQMIIDRVGEGFHSLLALQVIFRFANQF